MTNPSAVFYVGVVIVIVIVICLQLAFSLTCFVIYHFLFHFCPGRYV